MKVLAVIDAEIEARRFLISVQKVKGKFPEKFKACRLDERFWEASKFTARLKRASLDLTRSLAQMRRP